MAFYQSPLAEQIRTARGFFSDYQRKEQKVLEVTKENRIFVGENTKDFYKRQKIGG